MQVPKSENHILSIVSNTVTDSDLPGNYTHSKLDNPPRHQPSRERDKQQPVPTMDHPQLDAIVIRVALSEFVWMQAVLFRSCKVTLGYTPGKVPSVSNPTCY